MSKLIKAIAVIVTMVAVTSCTCGVHWDHSGTAEGYTKVTKVSLEDK